MIFMLNPYMIAAVLLAVAYTIINHFSEVKHRNRYAVLEFEKDNLVAKPQPNQWIGASRHISQDFYTFDDINVIRISGSDTIDLRKLIVTGRDNVVIIRKIYGPTKILVPRDVAVKLDVSAIYASVSYLGFPEYDLRNQSIKLEQKDDQKLLRSVKVVVNIFAGSVEVVRAWKEMIFSWSSSMFVWRSASSSLLFLIASIWIVGWSLLTLGFWSSSFFLLSCSCFLLASSWF